MLAAGVAAACVAARLRVPALVLFAGLGMLVGSGAVGGLLSRAARHAHRLPNGLMLVGSLATAGLAYGAAGALGGSGFLAVYMVGLALGDAPLADRETVVAFHRGFAMVAEIGMFFALGLLVFPSQFGPIVVEAVLLSLVTAFAARPIACFVATIGQGFRAADRALLAWSGLRGAVPVILATFAVIDEVPRGIELLNIVFFAVLLSAVVQGVTVQRLAERLLGPRTALAEMRAGPHSAVSPVARTLCSSKGEMK